MLDVLVLWCEGNEKNDPAWHSVVCFPPFIPGVWRIAACIRRRGCALYESFTR